MGVGKEGGGFDAIGCWGRDTCGVVRYQHAYVRGVVWAGHASCLKIRLDNCPPPRCQRDEFPRVAKQTRSGVDDAIGNTIAPMAGDITQCAASIVEQDM